MNTLKVRDEAIAALIAEFTHDHPESTMTPWSCELTTGVRDVGIVTMGSTETFLVNPDWLRRVESGDFGD